MELHSRPVQARLEPHQKQAQIARELIDESLSEIDAVLAEEDVIWDGLHKAIEQNELTEAEALERMKAYHEHRLPDQPT